MLMQLKKQLHKHSKKEKGKETTNREDERAPEIEKKSGGIKTSRVEKREERARGIRTKMNRINSIFNFVTTAPVSTITKETYG